MNRANQKGSPYEDVLGLTVGIVFLATPFRGSDASKQAQWQVLVGGIMGEETSRQLVDALNSSDRELRRLTQAFAELAGQPWTRLPIHCFYETRKTEMLRRLLSPRLASTVSAVIRHKTLRIVRILLGPHTMYG